MKSSALDALLKKQAMIEARIQLLKSKETSQKRKDDSRKKILAGAYLLEKHEKAGTLEELVQELDGFLSRKNDRALFGLPDRIHAI